MMKQFQSRQTDATEAAAEQDRSAPAVPGDQDTGPATQPTDPKFDAGSGAEETADGLDAEAEAIRRAAEGEPPASASDDDVPVFDRANVSERI